MHADEEQLTIGSVQEDVTRARSQTRQRLVTLTVQPIQEAALDVLVVVLSLRSKSSIEHISAIKLKALECSSEQTLSPGVGGSAGGRRRPL